MFLSQILSQHTGNFRLIMSDLNRGIMKFDGADKPVLVAVSAVVIFGGIAALIIWALSSAYMV